MSFDFAVNPLDVAAASAKVVVSLSDRGEDDPPWLLVDRALLDHAKLQTELRRLGWSQHNTLANSALSAFGEAAPALIALPSDPAVLSNGVQRILTIGAGAPAFSWLCTTAEASAVCQLMAELAMPKVDLDMSVHFRFADSRVLPGLWRALNPIQLAGVSKTVQSWCCFDRVGEVVRMPHAPLEAAVAWPSPFTLTDAQFKLMLDESEADSIFSLMLDKTPEVVPADGRGLFHQRLVQFLAKATVLNVEQPADRVQFVMLSLTCGERFYTHPPLQAMWAEIRVGKERLADAMKTWSAGLWSELQQYGGVKVKGLQ